MYYGRDVGECRESLQEFGESSGTWRVGEQGLVFEGANCLDRQKVIDGWEN